MTSFIRRVITLLENLPDEGPNGTAGGATEGLLIPMALTCMYAHNMTSSGRRCRYRRVQPDLCSFI